MDGEIVFVGRDRAEPGLEVKPALPRRELGLTPEAGGLLLFPSWVHHRVEVYRGKGARVAIAFKLWHPDVAVRKSSERRLLRSARKAAKRVLPKRFTRGVLRI